MTEHIRDILEEAPTNWGRWGDDDEIGAVNYFTGDEVLRGIAAVESGEVHALGTYVDHPDGDPVPPGAQRNAHHMLIDKGHYENGNVEAGPEGQEWAGDVLRLPVHGTTTHVDSPAHVWYDDQLYNGFDASTTIHGLDRCGIEEIADHSIVGRGVLLDVARHRGVDYLDRGERITLDELRDCADAQGVDVTDRDVILLRTGVMELFYDEGPDAFDATYVDRSGETPQIREPGPTYTPALVDWIDDNEIPLMATDTLTAEQTISEETGTHDPLHPALLRNLGVLLGELHYLPELAFACAEDGRYAFMYVCSPLKIVGGTGSPVNPVAIR
jgi:kynurenine formamidase